MRALPLAAAAAAVLLLAGCAQPADDAAPTPEPAPPAQTTQAPTPTPPPTPSEDPQADWQTVETPNGTASFRMPPGWTADIGGEELEYDGELHWRNDIALMDDSGRVRLEYADGPDFEDLAAVAEFGVVASEPVATLDDEELADALPHVFDPAYLEHAATAWWIDWGDQGMRAGISLTGAAAGAGEQQASHGVQDGRRGIWFGIADTLPDRDAALRWLEGDDTELLLDIIATLDLTGIPAPVLPEG